MQRIKITLRLFFLLIITIPCLGFKANAGQLNKEAIEKAAGTKATVNGDVVRIDWSRDDVAVRRSVAAWVWPAGQLLPVMIRWQ